jgi:hypothetical protein
MYLLAVMDVSKVERYLNSQLCMDETFSDTALWFIATYLVLYVIMGHEMQMIRLCGVYSGRTCILWRPFVCGYRACVCFQNTEVDASGSRLRCDWKNRAILVDGEIDQKLCGIVGTGEHIILVLYNQRSMLLAS